MEEFEDREVYKLYRSVDALIHPVISKKNISLYKIILDENILPVRVFYPKKMSETKEIIIYMHGEISVVGSENEYGSILKTLAYDLNKIIVAIDYNTYLNYKDIVLNSYSTIKYLYDEFNKIGYTNLILSGDSTGAGLLIHINDLLRKDKIYFDKSILFYPTITGKYNKKSKYESISKYSHLDMFTIKALDKYFGKIDEESCFDASKIKYDGKLLLFVGKADPLRDEIIDFYKNNIISSKLVQLDFCGHGFLIEKDSELRQEIYNDINKFLS